MLKIRYKIEGLKLVENSIEWWLYKLPEDIRNRALKNLRDSSWKKSLTIANSLSDAIDKAFDWSLSPEKHAYWSKLFSNS